MSQGDDGLAREGHDVRVPRVPGDRRDDLSSPELHPGTPLAEVEALFEQRDFNSLPVVSRDGILLGLVTKLDFLKAFAFTPHAVVPHYDEIMSQPVESVMTRPSISVRPDMMLTRFLQLMVDTRYHSVPVAIGALLVGIVSRQDVVRAIRRAAAGERPGRRGPGPECACEQTATVYH